LSLWRTVSLKKYVWLRTVSFENWFSWRLSPPTGLLNLLGLVTVSMNKWFL
jgi:hypothetical protein